MIQNFISMPNIMKFLLSLGMLSPLLVIFSLSRPMQIGDIQISLSSIELVLLHLSVLPIFISSIMMLKKFKSSKINYGIGFVIVSVAPTLMPSVRPYIDINTLLTQAGFNVIIAAMIILYFHLNKPVIEYYLDTK